METWLQVILIVSTVEMLLAVILPGVVVYMTLFKTPSEFKHFSLLLLIYSLVDATGSFGGWMTFNQRTGVNYPEDHLIVYVSYGLCTVFGPKFCFTLEMLNFIPLMFNLTLTTFNMGYRLYLLHRTAVNFKRISTILFGFAVPWISMTCYTLLQYTPAELIHPFFSPEQAELHGNYTIFGQLMADNWTSTVFEATAFYPFLCCGIALTFRHFLIKSIERMGRGISTRSYKLHKEMVWVLTIQSCCPLLITIAIGVFFTAVAANATHPVFQTLSYPIMVLTSIVDATVTLYYFLPYRIALLKWFGIKMVAASRLPRQGLSSTTR